MPVEICLVQGDITRLDVDALVNAANHTLIGYSGVAAAIQKAAGPELVNACRVLGGCEVGDAKITPGFHLPAKWVIHAVGPLWHGGRRNEDELLASCYRRALEIADEQGIRTIAFPSIGTGAHRFPRERAARIALRAIERAIATSRTLEKVYIVTIDPEIHEAYRGLIAEASEHVGVPDADLDVGTTGG